MKDLFNWLNDWGDDDNTLSPHAFADFAFQQLSDFNHKPKSFDGWDDTWDTTGTKVNDDDDRTNMDTSTDFVPRNKHSSSDFVLQSSHDSNRKQQKDPEAGERNSWDAQLNWNSPTGNQSSVIVVDSPCPQKKTSRHKAKSRSRKGLKKDKHRGQDPLKQQTEKGKTGKKQEVEKDKENIPKNTNVRQQQSRWDLCVPCWGSGGTKCGCGGDKDCGGCKGTGLERCSHCLGWGGLSVPV